MRKFKKIILMVFVFLLIYFIYRCYNYCLYKEAKNEADLCTQIVSDENTKKIIYYKLEPESRWVEIRQEEYDNEDICPPITLCIWISEDKIYSALIIYREFGNTLERYNYRADGTLVHMKAERITNSVILLYDSYDIYFSTKGKLLKCNSNIGEGLDNDKLKLSDLDVYYTTDELLEKLNIRLP